MRPVHSPWSGRLRPTVAGGHRGHRSPAFTLIEVLVVVAIIALLVAILLPSLATARAQAHSTVCLSQLEQQGKAAFLYAHETKGWFPSCQYDAIERIPKATRKLLIRMISGGSAKGSEGAAKVFYCPSNTIRPWTVRNFALDFADTTNEGRILYWWVANPHPDQAERFIDLNENGTRTDEYITKAEQTRPHHYAFSTDQSRQMAAGWYFFHGKEGLRPNEIDTRGLTRSWKNSVYGDGHAESVKAFKVIARWGLSNYAGW